MTNHPLDALAAELPQALFDFDRRAQGQQPYPLTATYLHRDDYAAQSARIMAVIGPLLAEAAAYDWASDAKPPACPNHLGDDPDGLPCAVAGVHRTHVFESAVGINTKTTEPQGDLP